MYYKKLTNFYVFVLSILAVNLLSDKITGFILGMRIMQDPARATLTGMAMLVFVLYPFFHYLDQWSEQAAKRLFKIGKHAGGKFIGVSLVFLLALSALFLFYFADWHGKNTLWNWLWALMGA